MPLEHRLFNWFAIMLIGLGTVGAIVNSYLPEANADIGAPVADRTIFAALYAGFFLLILGLAVCLGYWVRYLKQKMIQPIDHKPVVRQAFLVALGLTSLLILQGFHVLSWWDATLLSLALILVELSFHARGSLV